MLSATGEKYPLKAWDLNMNGLLNTLELSIIHEVKSLLAKLHCCVRPHYPSCHDTTGNSHGTNTIYGISKQAGERLCEWYHQRKVWT